MTGSEGLDPGFADVLARAAALPDVTDEGQAGDDTDDLIRIVVATSDRHISFPEPAGASQESRAFDPAYTGATPGTRPSWKVLP